MPTTLELKTSGRQFRRQFGAAIRGNLIRALTELITNSDDSYRRLVRTDQADFGCIQIIYDRRDRRISVVDWAEGMDAGDMRQMYPQYGGATSGLYENQNVRGFFGKGLKDVLFTMQRGIVHSIKADQVYTARFAWVEDVPMIEIDDSPMKATADIRQKLGITHGNGTRVSFKIPEKMSLPRHESLMKNLANFYMLRLINSSQQRRVILRTQKSKNQYEEDQVRYQFPAGEKVLEDTFGVGPYQVDLQLYRTNNPLTQSGEDREGGILVYDDQMAVLDLTLFGYDHDEHASRLFGLMQVKDFREVLKANENVLTDTRDGLDRHHPFNQLLAGEVEARLRPVVEREKHVYFRTTPGELSKRQRRRLSLSIDQINRLMNNLSDLKFALSDDDIDGHQMPPQGGIEFRPRTIRLRPHSKTVVRLRIDTSQILPGASVDINTQNGAISLNPKTFEVPAAPEKLVVTQNIVLSGTRIGQKARITASVNGFQAALNAQVVADAYPRPEGGFAFIPEVIRIANNSRRQASLYLHESIARPGDVIDFSVNQPGIEVDVDQVIVEKSHFRNGIARIELPVKGSGIGEKARVTASLGRHRTSLKIEVVSKTEKSRRGPVLLTGYRFDQTTPSRVRSSYDEETGLIWIYLRNPIVERYFGKYPLNIALNTPHCQILLAEIILEQIAWVARRKMIETGAAMYLGNNHTEEDLAAVRRFMAEYGDKIHSFIADDRVIDRVVQDISPDISVHEARRSQTEAVLPDPEFGAERNGAKSSVTQQVKNAIRSFFQKAFWRS